jgi:hypothetical protein
MPNILILYLIKLNLEARFTTSLKWFVSNVVKLFPKMYYSSIAAISTNVE